MIGGMSDYLENKLLDHALGKTAYTMPTEYVALFTTAPTDAGGGTEVVGNAYARQNATTALGAASGGQSTTSSQITFPDASGGDWGEILAWALFDALTNGNMTWWGWLGAGAEIPGVAANAGDVFTSYAHGLVNGNSVVLQAPEGGTLPTGVSANTRYYVVSASADTFQLSATLGGAAITLTSDGEFSAYKIAPKTINNGDGFKFNAGNLTFKVN